MMNPLIPAFAKKIITIFFGCEYDQIPYTLFRENILANAIGCEYNTACTMGG